MRTIRNWITVHVFGQRPSSTMGSNRRRLFSRLTAILVLYLAIEAFFPNGPMIPNNGPVYLLPAVWSVVFFAFVVAVIPFLTSQQFYPNPARLAMDTLLSIVLGILGFALIYRTTGINPDCVTTQPSSDYIYFSTVTFSTLGYGDFSPCGDAHTRLLAAFQAIFGNLHLGMVVGCAFFAAQRPQNNSTK